jgi:L-ribulose-5-phosphate 3-epimerase UlaE
MTNGQWEEMPFDEGAIDWGDQLTLLDEQDFQGPLSLEMNVEPRPKHGLRSATRLIRMLRDL